MTNWLRWQHGRQGSDYQKKLLFGAWWPIQFDLYLLRYPVGSHIPSHQDPNPLGRHYRLNIELKKAELGGVFHCEQTLFRCSRMTLFRPDLHSHSVSPIVKGKRYVLSLGWVLS